MLKQLIRFTVSYSRKPLRQIHSRKNIITMSYLFTSESVSEGHPDKVADQISDALLDNFLAFDPESKVACETMVTTGQVILAGEVKSNTYLDVQNIARAVVNKIGYTKGEYQFSGSRNDVWLCHQRDIKLYAFSARYLA